MARISAARRKHDNLWPLVGGEQNSHDLAKAYYIDMDLDEDGVDMPRPWSARDAKQANTPRRVSQHAHRREQGYIGTQCAARNNHDAAWRSAWRIQLSDVRQIFWCEQAAQLGEL